MVSCLLTHIRPEQVFLEERLKDQLWLIEALEAPKFIECLLIKENYLGAVIKSNKPRLRIYGYSAITRSMPHNAPFAVFTDSGWLHYTILVRHNSDRSMIYNSDSFLQKYDVPFIEILDFGIFQILKDDLLWESSKEWFLTKNIVNLQSMLLHVQRVY